MNITLEPARWEAFTHAIGRFFAGAWRPVRETARKLIPSRGARWTFLYVPGFYALMLLVLTSFGLTDLRDYLLEIGARSAPVLVAIALAMLVSTVLGWNLDNDERSYMQMMLHRDDIDSMRRFGALAVLAGEFLAISFLLVLFLAALLVWQG